MRSDGTLVWFRRDLRIADNPALFNACESSGPVYAVYVATPEQWQRHHVGPNQQAFILSHLQALSEQLDAIDVPLTIRTVPLFSDVPAVIETVCETLGISELYFNNELEINEQQRDVAVIQHLQHSGVQCHIFNEQTLLTPGAIKTGKGDYYRVFTPFKKAVVNQLQNQIPTPLAAPCSRKGMNIHLNVTNDPLPDIKPTSNKHWPVGEHEASQRLRQFIQHHASTYKQQRDIPSLAATSSLSPYLAVGAISLRQCFYAAALANQGTLMGGNEGLDCWISELIWREFYKHLIIGFPELCKGYNFNPDYRNIPWRDAPDEFNAWCEGRTGYPLVDAAMRQLTQTGWMHNRLRMVVAMFLTKHLMIDWRKGEHFFLQHLYDADLAANNGGWQWSASTGADAAPYFRIFNPTRQSTRFDADGDFIRQYLPELADLPHSSIHDPSSLERQMTGYPMPIVEHSFAVDRAKNSFKSALITANSC